MGIYKETSKYMKEGEDITFDQLLVNLKLTEKDYLLAVLIQPQDTDYILKKKT